jgi:hypothetical protein
LTDQAALAEVVTDGTDPNIRKAAAYRLTDQSVLAKIAVDGKDANTRKAAVEKLADQSLLARITADDKDANVRYAAAGRIMDADVLERIAKSHFVPHGRLGTIAELRRLLARSRALPGTVWISLTVDVLYGSYSGGFQVGYEKVDISIMSGEGSQLTDDSWQLPPFYRLTSPPPDILPAFLPPGRRAFTQQARRS